MRESLSLLIETAGLPVRTYASATAFLGALPNAGAGCVLTDVQMPGMNGLELQRRLAELGNRLPVIVMTGQGDVLIAVEALKAGARDFLEKPLDEGQLLAAVSSALSASEQTHEIAVVIARIAERIASLTPREREVMDHLVTGQPNKTIAYDLGASPRTIEVHRGRVMEKMGARSLSEGAHGDRSRRIADQSSDKAISGGGATPISFSGPAVAAIGTDLRLPNSILVPDN